MIKAWAGIFSLIVVCEICIFTISGIDSMKKVSYERLRNLTFKGEFCLQRSLRTTALFISISESLIYLFYLIH